jgi:hypothetical protein
VIRDYEQHGEAHHALGQAGTQIRNRKRARTRHRQQPAVAAEAGGELVDLERHDRQPDWLLSPYRGPAGQLAECRTLVNLAGEAGKLAGISMRGGSQTAGAGAPAEADGSAGTPAGVPVAIV